MTITSPSDPLSHDIATSLASWAPRGRSESWLRCRDEIAALVAGSRPSSVLDARRLMGGLTAFSTWAMQVESCPDVRSTLTVDLVERFAAANPLGLTSGTLSNVVGRLRRLRRAVDGEHPHATRRPRKARPGPYDPAELAALTAAGEGAPELAAALAMLHDGVPRDVRHLPFWTTARRAASDASEVSLLAARLRATFVLRALESGASAAQVINDHALTVDDLEGVRDRLPVADSPATRRLLRG